MDYSESSELKYDQGLKKLAQAWKVKEKELMTEKQAKLSQMTQELARLKLEFQESRKKLAYLEEKNSELQDQIKEVSLENLKLEEFKARLVDSLREDEVRSKRVSSKSAEEQGREFFIQAKSRLTYENFSVFSCFVKQLNEKSISKEMALIELKEVFVENEDLFETFANLLSFVD
jgi:septal ring factor EnvC (AmiA/AmiB activator)